MEAVDIWSKVAQFGVHKRSIDDPFYVKGNELCHSVLGKKSVVILDHEEFLHHRHLPSTKDVFIFDFN